MFCEHFTPDETLQQNIKINDSISFGNQEPEVILHVSAFAAPYFKRRQLLPNQTLVRELENFGLSLISQGIHSSNETQQMIDEMQATHNKEIKTLQKQLKQLTQVMDAFAEPVGAILQQDIHNDRVVYTLRDIPTPPKRIKNRRRKKKQ